MGFQFIEAVVEFLHGIHFHEPAIIAGTTVGWSGDEVFIWSFFLQAVEHAALGDDDDILHGGVFAECHHFFG